jgi:hypothetical protein
MNVYSDFTIPAFGRHVTHHLTLGNNCWMLTADWQFAPVTADALSVQTFPNEGLTVNTAFLRKPIQRLERIFGNVSRY